MIPRTPGRPPDKRQVFPPSRRRVSRVQRLSFSFPAASVNSTPSVFFSARAPFPKAETLKETRDPGRRPGKTTFSGSEEPSFSWLGSVSFFCPAKKRFCLEVYIPFFLLLKSPFPHKQPGDGPPFPPPESRVLHLEKSSSPCSSIPLLSGKADVPSSLPPSPFFPRKTQTLLPFSPEKITAGRYPAFKNCIPLPLILPDSSPFCSVEERPTLFPSLARDT